MTRDRLPPIPLDRLTPEQRAARDEIVSGRRGDLYGPFVPLLRSPELLRRLQRVGEYLRYEPAFPPALREMVILLTARAWTQDFEWDAHAPVAAEVGLGQDVVQAIAEGRRPERLSADEALVYDFVAELERTRTVSDRTYDAAVARFGEQGVVDLVAVAGYYALLAMLMNVAGTALPPGTSPVLRALPR